MAESQAKIRKWSSDEKDNLPIFEDIFGKENSGEEFEGVEFTSSGDKDPEIDDIQWKEGCNDRI